MKVVLGMPLGDFILALITGIATLAALFIGVSTLIQSAALRKKEYKARLLDELKAWALDFQNTNIPNTTTMGEMRESLKLGTQWEEVKSRKERLDLLTKFAGVFFESPYIRELAKIVFKTDLEDTFKHIDIEMAAISFLISRDIDTPYEPNPITSEIVKKLEESLKNGNESVETLLKEHRRLLTLLLRDLLRKIADTKAKLL